MGALFVYTMPTKASHPCASPSCPNTTHARYCPVHQMQHAVVDTRPSPDSRGYGYAWQKIRERVLIEHGIPRELWREYDIHHDPPYNPAVDPDHTHYTLTPALHGQHSQHTAGKGGGFGNYSTMMRAGSERR